MDAVLKFLSGSADGGRAADPHTLPIVTLLLMMVSFLALAMLFLSFVRRQVRAARLKREQEESFAPAPRFDGLAHAALFDSPCRWIAVRSGDVQAVQEALHLHNATACSWEEGLAGARDHRLFISPPVGDWILVVGSGLPDPSEDVDKCFHFLRHLGRELGQVQFFSFNRALHHHAWARLNHGRVLRAYAWAGHTVWNEGRMTAEEAALGLRCFHYTEPALRADFTEPAPVACNTDKVPALAARWSLDPTALDGQQLGANPGITGEFSQSRPF